MSTASVVRQFQTANKAAHGPYKPKTGKPKWAAVPYRPYQDLVHRVVAQACQRKARQKQPAHQNDRPLILARPFLRA